MISDGKCSELASFFSEKINNVRKLISTSLSCSGVRQITQQPEKVVTMSDFGEIDGKMAKPYSTLKHQPAPLTHFQHFQKCVKSRSPRSGK